MRPPPQLAAEPAATPLAPEPLASAAPEAFVPPPTLPITAENKGVFLQLGAFGSQDNADNYLARLKVQLDWLAPSLHVYRRDNLYRVHAGPYASQGEARQAAERLAQALGIRPLVLTR
jgi:rare lipoprotein A